MPTYIQRDTVSDVDPITKLNPAFSTDRDLITGVGTDTSILVSILDGADRSQAFITIAGIPNSDLWQSGGTHTVELEVIIGNMDLRGRVRVGRIDSVGTVLQVGAFTGFQTLSGGAFLAFSPVAPTWTGGEEACGNRYFVEFEFENVNGMGMSRTLEIGLGTAVNEVVTDITENSAGCVAAGDDSEFAEVVA